MHPARARASPTFLRVRRNAARIASLQLPRECVKFEVDACIYRGGLRLPFTSKGPDGGPAYMPAAIVGNDAAGTLLCVCLHALDAHHAVSLAFAPPLAWLGHARLRSALHEWEPLHAADPSSAPALRSNARRAPAPAGPRAPLASAPDTAAARRLCALAEWLNAQVDSQNRREQGAHPWPLITRAFPPTRGGAKVVVAQCATASRWCDHARREHARRTTYYIVSAGGMDLCCADEVCCRPEDPRRPAPRARWLRGFRFVLAQGSGGAVAVPEVLLPLPPHAT